MSSGERGLRAEEALLERFVGDIERPEGLLALSNALSQIAAWIENTSDAEYEQRCRNLASSYARMSAARLAPDLASKTRLHPDVIWHWIALFETFESHGFKLPQEAAECRVGLFVRMVQLLSPEDRQKLQEELDNQAAD